MSDYNAKEYWDDIKSIAADIRAEYPDPDKHHNERCDMIHESVDGSAWIIYTAGVEGVLSVTRNEPDGKEVSAMSAPGADWREQQRTAAYMAMHQDVVEELARQDKDAAEAAMERSAE